MYIDLGSLTTIKEQRSRDFTENYNTIHPVLPLPLPPKKLHLKKKLKDCVPGTYVN